MDYACICYNAFKHQPDSRTSRYVQKIKDWSTFKFADTRSYKNLFFRSQAKCSCHNKIIFAKKKEKDKKKLYSIVLQR